MVLGVMKYREMLYLFDPGSSFLRFCTSMKSLVEWPTLVEATGGSKRS
jgi:hypothetical protein